MLWGIRVPGGGSMRRPNLGNWAFAFGGLRVGMQIVDAAEGSLRTHHLFVCHAAVSRLLRIWRSISLSDDLALFRQKYDPANVTTMI